MPVFRACDIRGIFAEKPADELSEDELSVELAERIGLAFAALIEGRTVVVGRDARLAAPPMQAALIRGLTRGGKDVVDVGQATTPMLAFAVASLGGDGGVQTTASHSPRDTIGFMFWGRDAAAIGYDDGIEEIERRVRDGDLPEADVPGSTSARDVLPAWLDHLMAVAGEVHGLKVVIDAGNGVAGRVMRPLFERLDCEMVPLYFEADGSFPNHEPNPLEARNLADLRKRVVEESADLGIAFDGAGDRVVLVCETGEPVPGDLATALIAWQVRADEPGSTVLYDLRSSRAVREEIEARGGVAVASRVGRPFVQAAMREHDAALGGELSGRYYFRENHGGASGSMALLKTLALLCREPRPLSELVAPLRRYYGSGAIRSDVADPAGKLAELAHAYDCGRATRLDGLSVEFDDWWFNVRPAAAAPALWLVVEATTRERMAAMRDHLLEHVRRPYRIRRILFPTDFSVFSLGTLPYAVGLAEDYRAEIHLLHVVPTPDWTVQFEQIGPVLDPTFFEQMTAAAAERLDTLVPDEARERLAFVAAVRRGTPFLEIVRYAREHDVDLVVIATHGRTGLRHALFGSVAEKVVRKAPCPVLSVRPEGHGFAMP